MSAPFVRTKTPGIYRRGSRYVYTWRDQRGKLRRRSAATMAEAKAKRGVELDKVRRGERTPDTSATFADYAARWINEYPARRAISEATAEDYRRALGIDEDGSVVVEGRAVDWFGRVRLASIGPAMLREYAAHVASTGVARDTMRLRLAPVLALLATAFDDEVIASNPSPGMGRLLPAKPRRSPDGEEEAAKRRPLDAAELERLLDAISAASERWLPFFQFLAEAGLRFGEACEVRWRDLDLDDELHPGLRVERGFYRGRVELPKGGKTRRVPLTRARAAALRALRTERNAGDDDLVFTSPTGRRLSHSNVMRRVLKPAAVEAGLGEWVETPTGRKVSTFVGFHTLRKTCATRLLVEMDPVLGRPWVIDEVQAMLGHTDRATTAKYYVAVKPETLPEPRSAPTRGDLAADLLARATEAKRGENGVGTRPTETGRNGVTVDAMETA